jgi:hypothetical protein
MSSSFKLGKSREFIWNLKTNLVSTKEFTFAKKYEKLVPKMKKYRKIIDKYNTKLIMASNSDTNPNNSKKVKFWLNIMKNLNALILRTEVLCNMYDISVILTEETTSANVYRYFDKKNLEDDKIKIANNSYITEKVKRELLKIINDIIIIMMIWI